MHFFLEIHMYKEAELVPYTRDSGNDIQEASQDDPKKMTELDLVKLPN